MFGKKKTVPVSYDEKNEYPVLRISICTGEKVAGFKSRTGGHFRDICLIRTQADIDSFCESCGIDVSELVKEY